MKFLLLVRLYYIYWLACFLAGYGISSQALDITHIYRSAILHDSQWLAQKKDHESRKEKRHQSLALLLPSIHFSSSISGNSYTSQGDSIYDIDCSGVDASLSSLCNQIFSNNTVADSEEQRYNSFTHSFNINQVIYNRELWLLHQQSLLELDMADHSIGELQQDLMFRVVKSYFDLLTELTNKAHAKAELSANINQFEIAKRMVENGLSTVTDIYDAKNAYHRSQTELIRYDAAVKEKNQVLSSITGIDFIQPNVIDRIPLEQHDWSHSYNWVQSGLDNSLLLKRLYLEKQQLDYTRDRAASNHYPQVHLNMSYRNNRNYGGQGFIPGSESTLVQLNFHMPLFEGGKVMSEVREAEIKVQAMQERIISEQKTLKLRIEQVIWQLGVAKEQIKIFQKSIMNSSRALQSVRVDYESGIRPVIDVIQARRRVFSEQSLLEKQKITYMIQYVRLWQLCGIMSEEQLQVLDTWLKPTNQLSRP